MTEECDVFLDCEEGRRLGCATFCCRLIVRLKPEDRGRGVPGVEPGANCLPKDTEGLCVHMDRETSLCRIWRERPSVCREYDCNHDSLLSVVLRNGFTSLTQLVRDSARLRRAPGVSVPLRASDREATK
jgi:hypothetical protein